MPLCLGQDGCGFWRATFIVTPQWRRLLASILCLRPNENSAFVCRNLSIFFLILFRFPCFQFKLPRLTFTTHHFSYLFNIFHFAIYSRDAFFFLVFRASTGLRFFWPFKNLFASLLYCYGLCSFCFRSLGFHCCRQCRRGWIVFVNLIVFSDLIVLYTQAF